MDTPFCVKYVFELDYPQSRISCPLYIAGVLSSGKTSTTLSYVQCYFKSVLNVPIKKEIHTKEIETKHTNTTAVD